MRNKSEKTQMPIHSEDGVANGIPFEDDVENLTIPSEKQKSRIPNSKNGIPTEVDPNRSYSPYYQPKPKLGSRGGVLGRGAVEKSKRKVQFSVTCTPDQKQKFFEAAKNDGRSLPNLICRAVEEYIENHKL